MLIVLFWLWIDSPAIFERFAGRFLLAVVLLIVFVGLALRTVRRRTIGDMRQLQRVVRRLETGDFDGRLPRFANLEVGHVARGCVEIGRRMRLAEEQLIDLRDRARRDRIRQEALLESVESDNERLRAETTVLHDFGGVLSRSPGPAQVCSELIRNIRGKVEFQFAAVYLLDEQTGTIAPQAVLGGEDSTPLVGSFLQHLSARQALSTRTMAGWVAKTGTVVRIDDTLEDTRYVDAQEGTRSALVVPLRARQSVVGAIQLENAHPRAYDESDARILASLANQAGIAVENIRLVGEAAKVQALREIDRLKSELLSTVSHELRTPLASIKGYAETLLREDVSWDDETRRDFLHIIDEESDRLGELIEDLLQMSQIEAGILRVDPAPCRLPRIVHRVVKKARASAGRHTINVVFAKDFPTVRADQRRVEQVLRNLVENAVKYSPEGGTVTVCGDALGTEVRIAVSDEGIGIAPNDLAHVFERFYRAESAAVRRAGGTGLGLSICHGIIQMHGGRIWAESKPGAGSTFLFTLPVASTTAGTDEVTGDYQEEPD